MHISEKWKHVYWYKKFSKKTNFKQKSETSISGSMWMLWFRLAWGDIIIQTIAVIIALQTYIRTLNCTEKKILLRIIQKARRGAWLTDVFYKPLWTAAEFFSYSQENPQLNSDALTCKGYKSIWLMFSLFLKYTF